jgi:hypothetical protein
MRVISDNIYSLSSIRRRGPRTRIIQDVLDMYVSYVFSEARVMKKKMHMGLLPPERIVGALPAGASSRLYHRLLHRLTTDKRDF